MIQGSTFSFLKDLAKNNHKEWFDANRKAYENARKDFAGFIDKLIPAMAKFDPTIAHLTAKDCMFRINRDVRFSKDKSPYKTNFGASICRGGKKAMLAGYYVHLEPGKSFIGGGLYMPMAPELKKVRQEIDYCYDEFGKLIRNKSFIQTYGDLDKSAEYSLANAPKGYEKDHTGIEYLKLKSFIAGREVPDKEVLATNFLPETAKGFKTLKPLLDFLNRSLLEDH